MLAEWVLEGVGRVLLHEKPEAISLAMEGPRVLTFDREGRPYAAFLAGRNYRRGLDNRVLEKWSEEYKGRQVRRRRWLTPEETELFLDQWRDMVQSVYQGLRRGPRKVLRDEAPSPAEWRAWLAKILSYDPARLEGEGKRYREIYHAVSILPPDQYRAVVVQATEGCHWNRCTFCDLYRDRSFRIRSEEEFRSHVRAVKSFLGEGLTLRKSIFLGDANALIVTQSRLQHLFAILGEEFALLPAHLTGSERSAWRVQHPGGMEGIYSFIDAFSPRQKSVADFVELVQWGLRRVYVGLETGHAPLLQWLNKPGHPEDLEELVGRLKRARLQVGVILLVGAGGEAFAEGHVRDSVALVNRLPLDSQDLIYLSELIDPPHGEYARRMSEAGIAALDWEQIQAQLEALRAGLQASAGPSAPKVVPYHLREFVY